MIVKTSWTLAAATAVLVVVAFASQVLAQTVVNPADPGRPPMFAPPAYRNFARLSASSDVNISFTIKSVVTPPTAAEYHCIDKSRIFVVAGSPTRADNAVHVYDINATAQLEYVGPLDLTLPGDAEVFGEPNSCVAFEGSVYVVVTPFGAIGTSRGRLMVFNSSSLELKASFVSGFNPDHAYYSPNHRFVVTADEGEPPQVSPYDPSTDPAGGATILDLQTNTACSFQFNLSGWSAAEFNSFRVHQQILASNMSHDLEPEYVSFDPQDSTRAYLTCQEASAIVVVSTDPNRPCTSESRVLAIYPLGWKDYRPAFVNNTGSFSDRFANGTTYTLNNLPYGPSPLFGAYQPDGTKGFKVGNVSFFITANEGDSKDRDFFGDADEASVARLLSPLGYTFNASANWSPYTNSTVGAAGNLNRLNVLVNEGRPTGSNAYDFLVSQGGRGFAVWKFSASTGAELVYESGDSTELELKEWMKTNSASAQQIAFADRTRRKGSEPESVLTMTTPLGRVIAGVAFERASAIGFYDVSNPAAPQTINYVAHPDMFGPEGVNVISPQDSPTGKYLLVVNGEGVSATPGLHRLFVFEMTVTETPLPTQGGSASHLILATGAIIVSLVSLLLAL